MTGRLHHRQMRFVVDPEVVHHTWFAISETFCGRTRDRNMWGFASNMVTCLSCIAMMDVVDAAWRTLKATVSQPDPEEFASLSSEEELAIVRQARRHGT